MAVPLITAGIGLLKSAVGGWFEHKQAKTEKKRQVELATPLPASHSNLQSSTSWEKNAMWQPMVHDILPQPP